MQFDFVNSLKTTLITSTRRHSNVNNDNKKIINLQFVRNCENCF